MNFKKVNWQGKENGCHPELVKSGISEREMTCPHRHAEFISASHRTGNHLA